MKKLKISLIALFAVVLGIAGSAFTTKQMKLSDTTYHYTSGSAELEDMQLIDNWVAEEPGCGQTGDIPCAVPFDGNRSAFQTYLNGITSVSELNAAATEKKNSD